MPKQNTTEKIVTLIDKLETRGEIVETYQLVTQILTTKLQSIQKKQEEEASATQDVIDKIKGN